MRAEVWFYHLEREPLETVLPRILTGLLARDVRVCVHVRERQTAENLSQRLWSSEDTAFPAHGLDGDPFPERQPLWLTSAAEVPNQAPFRFFCETLLPQGLDGLERASIMLEGNKDEAVKTAREAWKRYRSEGISVRYWRQDENGRWADQAAKT